MITNDVLYGKQIYLKMCTVDMANEKYLNWLNTEVVNQYLETRYEEQTIEKIVDYIRSNIESDNQLLFAINEKENDMHIGNIHLTFENYHKRCSIAYIIGECGFWGKGIGTEAMKLATKWAFENSNIIRTEAGMYSCNIGSYNVSIKSGYKKEGTRPKYWKLGNGTFVDGILVGLLREDYEKLDYSKE